jgi:hypothetical protein
VLLTIPQRPSLPKIIDLPQLFASAGLANDCHVAGHQSKAMRWVNSTSAKTTQTLSAPTRTFYLNTKTEK